MEMRNFADELVVAIGQEVAQVRSWHCFLRLRHSWTWLLGLWLLWRDWVAFLAASALVSVWLGLNRRRLL